jgi:hypothetical protein
VQDIHSLFGLPTCIVTNSKRDVLHNRDVLQNGSEREAAVGKSREPEGDARILMAWC